MAVDVTYTSFECVLRLVALYPYLTREHISEKERLKCDQRLAKNKPRDDNYLDNKHPAFCFLITALSMLKCLGTHTQCFIFQHKSIICTNITYTVEYFWIWHLNGKHRCSVHGRAVCTTPAFTSVCTSRHSWTDSTVLYRRQDTVNIYKNWVTYLKALWKCLFMMVYMIGLTILAE